MSYLDALNIVIELECTNELTLEQATQLEEADKVVRLFNMLDKAAA